ncbi:hypothetical protein [Persephonella sp.]|uniref:hypothetical protein n=1 Tax=Persephonella sp. TaxID=2060922 RepID=UPI0026136798|nr:hypothetical protein [Persephonella sp.]
MMDIFEGFIKKIEYEINQKRKILSDIENQIVFLVQEKEKLKQNYTQIENEEYSEPMLIQMKINSLIKIMDKISSIDQKLEDLEKKADKIRMEIKEKNAEKKAIKKEQEKLRKLEEKDQLKKETQLADEAFNRKH